MALGLSLCAGASATGRRFGCAERLLTKRPVWRLEQFSGTVDFPKGPCAQRVYTLSFKYIVPLYRYFGAKVYTIWAHGFCIMKVLVV